MPPRSTAHNAVNEEVHNARGASFSRATCRAWRRGFAKMMSRASEPCRRGSSRVSAVAFSEWHFCSEGASPFAFTLLFLFVSTSRSTDDNHKYSFYSVRDLPYCCCCVYDRRAMPVSESRRCSAVMNKGSPCACFHRPLEATLQSRAAMTQCPSHLRTHHVVKCRGSPCVAPLLPFCPGEACTYPVSNVLQRALRVCATTCTSPAKNDRVRCAAAHTAHFYLPCHQHARRVVCARAPSALHTQLR